MDALTKKKEIRQKLQRKLASQSAEIQRLKDKCQQKDREINRLGGAYVHNDGQKTRIAIEMMVDNRMANEHHEDYWEFLVCELGIKIGRQIVSEKIKQAFKNGLGCPYQMAEAKGRWIYKAMCDSSVYTNLNPVQLESAWNSALEAVTKYANSHEMMQSSGLGTAIVGGFLQSYRKMKSQR